MKKGLLVFVMITLTMGAFSQVMVMDTLDGHFERGTILHPSWRALEVAGGALFNFIDGNAYGQIAISNDAFNGNYAVEVTMPSQLVHADLQDAVFDVFVPVKPGKKYVWKVAAYASQGDGRMRPHCTIYDSGFYSGTPGIVADYASDDLSFNLGTFYDTYVWAIPDSLPAGSAVANIGFRMMGTDGSRWAQTDVTVLVDDFEFWEDSVGVMNQLTTNVIGDGTVNYFPMSPSLDGKYWQNSTIRLDGVPGPGLQGMEWTGDVNSVDDTVYVTMDTDKTVTVEFTHSPLMVMDTLDGHFERGTILHPSWRALEVAGGALFNFIDGNAYGQIAISNDAFDGNYAVEVTMPSQLVHADLQDAVFDVFVPVKPGKKYVWKVAAYASQGDGRMRPHCTIYDSGFYSGTPGIVADYASDDLSFNLGTFYDTYVWAIPDNLPAGSAVANIGFRMMGTDGSRWAQTDVTVLVDDFEFWQDSVGVMKQLTTNITGNGTVSYFPLSPSLDGKYWQYSTIQLAAVPDANNQFVGWTGDVTSSQDTISVMIDTDKTISAEFSAASGVEVKNAGQIIGIYPNPVYDVLHIQSIIQITDVKIYNVTGEMVLETYGNVTDINVENLDAGMYFVKINSKEGSVLKKMLKK